MYSEAECVLGLTSSFANRGSYEFDFFAPVASEFIPMLLFSHDLEQSGSLFFPRGDWTLRTVSLLALKFGAGAVPRADERSI